MAKIIWDELEARSFEYGVSKAVLYSNNGLFSPWNGVVSVSEARADSSFEELYFDSKKVLNFPTNGFYECTVEAYGFPDSFLDELGIKSSRPGILLTNQERKAFNFSYQTKTDSGYKIHLVANVVSTRPSTDYTTISDSVSPETSNFVFKPVLFEAYNENKPSAHIIIDSQKVDPFVLSAVEDLLYGTETTDPQFPIREDLVVPI